MPPRESKEACTSQITEKKASRRSPSPTSQVEVEKLSKLKAMENEWQKFASPYVNIETTEDKDGVQSRFRMAMKRVPTSATALKLLAFVIYVPFFIWQVIGLILYTIRAFETCLVAKHTSFQSMHIDTFHRSAQLQLAWVVSQIFNSALVILALSYVPSFLGWSVIPRLLVRLPAFWSLLSLYAMTIVGYGMILSLENGKKMKIALIMAFTIRNGAQIVLIGFLNFTQINHSRKMFHFKVFAFVKINIFLLLLTYFLTFVIGSLQFALRVYGVDKTATVSNDFFYTVVAIRRFTQIVFFYRIYIFYWEKLFVDHRNILCHHDHLDDLVKETQ
ncbi:uncharacterized protein LOC144634642 isoform X1 [Oculina patagonica]